MRSEDTHHSSMSKDDDSPSSADTKTPTIQLPNGGGVIRGIGEKFAANPVIGIGSTSVPISMRPGRSGFGPQLFLSYDSGAGNGPFGFGWSLSLLSITRNTDKGHPQYFDGKDSDVFILSGAEDLVPVLNQNAQGKWEWISLPIRTAGGVPYQVHAYRPRIEGFFARIECWTNTTDAKEIFRRSISKDNITTWYGRTAESLIADPTDATRIFSWPICQSHYDKGSVLVFDYKREYSTRIFENIAVIRLSKKYERNCSDVSRSAQRDFKRIRLISVPILVAIVFISAFLFSIFFSLFLSGGIILGLWIWWLRRKLLSSKRAENLEGEYIVVKLTNSRVSANKDDGQ